jgi:hypothetical protein
MDAGERLMTFQPENDLESALQRAMTDAASRPEFYRLMLDSDLFTLGRTEGNTDREAHVAFTAMPGDTMQIASILFNGRNSIPIFSALSRLQSYIREADNYLCMNGRALFEMTKGASFILNPGFYGKEFLPGEIAQMLDPSVANTLRIEKPTQVLIGQPAVYPHALIDALKVAFAARSDVLAAYLVQIAFEAKNEPPHPLIGVEVAGDWKPVSAEIGRIASAVMPGALLDAVPIDRAKNTTLTSSLLKTTPFYTRNDPKH